MGFKLAVVMVSAYRHCPSLGLPQTRLYSTLQDYEKPTIMALDKQTSARCQVGNKEVFLMPRENDWHHRKGTKSESHDIKGEVFQMRVLSAWKTTRPRASEDETDATRHEAKHWQNSRRRGDVTEVVTGHPEGEDPQRVGKGRDLEQV